MNNKGFTLVELLVSFILSMIIVVILFQLIINLKDVYMTSGLKTELLNKQNLMTNKIYSDLLDKQVTTINNCEDTNICVEFTYDDSTSKKLIVDEESKILTYDNYVIKLDSNSYFNNIYIYTDKINIDNGKYDRLLNINIPIYNDSFDNTDFGLNIVYMYGNSDVSNTSITKYGVNQQYEDIEYVYSNGNQYINTNYIPKTNTEIQLDIQFIANSNTNTDTAKTSIVGKESQNNNNANFQFNFGAGASQNKQIYYWVDKTYGYGGQIKSRTYSTVTKRSTFIVKSGTAIFQGVTTAIATKTADNTDNMLLLGTYYSSADPAGIYAFNMYDSKVYSFKILEGETLVRDYVPVRRKIDRVVGLYDKVNDVFYRSNSGTDFIYLED